MTLGDGIEVHSELRVPFTPDEFNVEAWLRAEKPGQERIASLIAAQPEHMRPILQRLFKAAIGRIVEDTGYDPTLTASVEERNHAEYLAASPALTKELPDVPKPIGDLDEAREEIAVLQGIADRLERENAVLTIRVRELEDEIAARAAAPRGGVVEGVGDSTPEPAPETPSAEALAASDALLDAALVDEDDDDEFIDVLAGGDDE